MSLRFCTGDFWEHAADIRVNAVNCVGVMGKGIALEFRQRYPAMFRAYVDCCRDGWLKPGKLHCWEATSGTLIINFPTKRHWRNPSSCEYVREGLVALRGFLTHHPGKTVVMPALGCGHGGLDWTIVRKMIEDVLGDLPDVEVVVFEP